MSNNEKYILIDDSAISIGGTELSLLGIFEDRLDNIIAIKTQDLNTNHFQTYKDHIWIFANIMGLYKNPGFLEIVKLLETINFYKIEFDYNFCIYRGEYPHIRFTNQQCLCPYGITGDPACANLYDKIIKLSRHIFFMSEKQRAIYSNHLPFLNFSKTSILSSCFTKESLNLFDSLKDNIKNNKYAILDGYNPWHSEAKGREAAKTFCLSNNLEYDILPTQPYQDHIKLLSQYKGMVFLPTIHDTCPRCIIEAKLLNLEVIANINCQHITEYWWKDNITIKNYLLTRPQHFWNIIDNI